jgi:serine/threonine protein kinase
MHEYVVGDEPVPGYQIVRPLGVGGYGTVWVAKSPGDVEIALKVINLQGQGLKEFRALSLVKRLRHPNLIPIYAFWLKDEYGNLLDAGAQDSVNLRGKQFELIIAMGLGDMSLAQRLDKCKQAFAERHGLPDTDSALIAKLQELGGGDLAGIPVEELLDYMTGSAKAIDYLNQPTHNLGTAAPTAIQHCDIKPGNLLIVSNDVQVCDYGLARVTGDARKTQAAGTPAYMAPELFANKPSSGTDQYSLAITYYELRTGKLPFDEQLAFHAHITGELDFSLVTPAEQEILRRATHKRPPERYPHTIDMVRVLREVLWPSRPPTGSGIPSYQPVPTPLTGPSIPVLLPQTPSGFPSGGGVYPASGGSNPTIVSRPQIVDDLIRAGVEIVPGHRLEQKLGHGGYGEVWSATMPGKTRCALKIVRNLEGVQGKQEFQSLDKIRDLDHDRLIRLQAYWLLAGDGSVIPDEQIGQPTAPKANALVVATDLAHQNLLQRWHECHDQGGAGIPKDELVPYMRQSAEAIDYLNFQESAIVHRDIKPENILLTRDRRVKVSDFGLAKVVEGTSAQINAASVGMTLAYAAPEVFHNQVTRATDQYSLAVTYYRLRVGRLPFEEGLGQYQLMQAHVSGSLDFSGVGEAEQAVLRRACAVDPAARFTSCLEFVEALEIAAGVSRPVLMGQSAAHIHPASSPNTGPAGARRPGAPVPMTVPFGTAPSDGGSDIRATVKFEEAKLPLGTPTGRPPGGVLPPDSAEFQLPFDPRRPGLPAGLTETTTNLPSPSDVDTDPDASRSGWRKGTAAPAKKSGGKGVLIAAAVVIIALAGAVAKPTLDWIKRNDGTGGGSGLATLMEQRTAAVDAKLDASDIAGAEKLVADTVASETPKPDWEKWAEGRHVAIDKKRAAAKAETEQRITTLLDGQKFPEAAKEIQDAADVFGPDWAGEQNLRAGTAWRTYAEGRSSIPEKLAEYRRLADAYPRDDAARNRVASLTFEEENKHLSAKLEQVLALLAEGKFAQSRPLVDEVKAEFAELGKRPREGSTADAYNAFGGKLAKVSAALTDLEKVSAEANDSPAKDLTAKAAAAAAGEPESSIRHAYRLVLGQKIEHLVPKLGKTTDWGQLLAACRAAGPKNPWVTGARAECVTELIRNRQFTGLPTEKVLPDAAAADPSVAAYYQYVAASRGWLEAKTDDEKEAAAGRLAALAAAPESPADRLGEYRVGRVLSDLRAAVDLVRGADRLAPFAGPKAATAATWLAAAERLADRLPPSAANLSPDELQRLRLDLAVALLAQQPPDAGRARPLADKLVADTAWVDGLAVPERVLLWVTYARGQESAADGRPKAVQALIRVMTLLRDGLSEVPADFVYKNVIRRLVPADSPQDVIGAAPGAAEKGDAAQLCALAARNVDRHAKAWEEVADLGPEGGREGPRRQLALELFKRAAALAPTAENRAWVGIAQVQTGNTKGLGQFLPADADAAVPAVCLLRGIVLIDQADSELDRTKRVKAWMAADDAFRAGLKLFAAPTEPGAWWNELVLLYEHAADNCVKLANNVPRDQIAGFLEKADQDAKNLLAVDRTCLAAHDIRGCALEDMAWLVKGDGMFAKYDQAVKAFTDGLGGFGARARARMHRGRCQAKWAADLSFSGKGEPGLVTELLDSAEADLNAALGKDRETVVAVEAEFWQARAAELRWRLAPVSGKKAFYAQAAGSFKWAAEQAKKLGVAEWRAAALQFWALAAYNEANRLASDQTAAATAAFKEAVARAVVAKEVGRPWAAQTLMDLYAGVQPRLDGKDHLKEAMDAGRDGLGGDQDKPSQFQILIRLAEYRTSILDNFSDYRDGPRALADATAALDLATKDGLGPQAEAEAHGAKGLADYFRYLGFGTERKNQPADLEGATKEFEAAVGLAPNHRKAWKWKVYLAGFRMPGPGVKPQSAAATRYAEAYRLFREAETTNPDQPGEEHVYQKDVIGPGRADAQRRGAPVWYEMIASDAELANPDRPKWLLAAAEALAVQKKETKTAKEYVDQARKGLAKLPADQQPALAAQLARTDQLLKAAGGEPK